MNILLRELVKSRLNYLLTLYEFHSFFCNQVLLQEIDKDVSVPIQMTNFVSLINYFFGY